MKDFKKLQEMDRRARELAGLYAAEKERADSLAEELRPFAKIRKHYEHAKEKHPYFCNRLSYRTLYGVVGRLKDARDELELNISSGTVSFRDVLDCEIAEAEREMVYGNPAAAIEECYDAIAVLLRVVDVLEGRQALGDPAKNEEEK